MRAFAICFQGMFIVTFPYTVIEGGYWAMLAMAVVACHLRSVQMRRAGAQGAPSLRPPSGVRQGREGCKRKGGAITGLGAGASGRPQSSVDATRRIARLAQGHMIMGST